MEIKVNDFCERSYVGCGRFEILNIHSSGSVLLGTDMYYTLSSTRDEILKLNTYAKIHKGCDIKGYKYLTYMPMINLEKSITRLYKKVKNTKLARKMYPEGEEKGEWLYV